jgi:hypothetical protein
VGQLTGENVAAIRRLIDGGRSWLIRSDTAEAGKKRHQRATEETLRCIGRGEGPQTFGTDLFVPVTWRLQCCLTRRPPASTSPSQTTIAVAS